MRAAIGLVLGVVLVLAAVARAADLSQGAQGPAVADLQSELVAVGEHPGPIDGVFGPLTLGAVLQYQRSRGIAADGIVGPATRYQLDRQLDARTLTPGDRGAAVARLERALSRRGLYSGPIDGIFGPEVEAAVTALERQAGLRPTGEAGPRVEKLLWDPVITVTPGMTLSALGAQYGVSAAAIARANHQSLTAFIDAGQTLTLPWPATGASPKGAPAAATADALAPVAGGPIALALSGPVQLGAIGARLDAIGHPPLSAFVPASTSRSRLEGLLAAGTEVDAALTGPGAARRELRTLDARLSTLAAPAAAVASGPGAAPSIGLARALAPTGAAYLVGFHRVTGATASQIVRRAMAAAAPGGVLMLPITSASLSALPAVLTGLERQGYVPESVRTLLGG